MFFGMAEHSEKVHHPETLPPELRPVRSQFGAREDARAITPLRRSCPSEKTEGKIPMLQGNSG
jgi:hypothetical protein